MHVLSSYIWLGQLLAWWSQTGQVLSPERAEAAVTEGAFQAVVAVTLVGFVVIHRVAYRTARHLEMYFEHSKLK